MKNKKIKQKNNFAEIYKALNGDQNSVSNEGAKSISSLIFNFDFTKYLDYKLIILNIIYYFSILLNFTHYNFAYINCLF